MKIQQLCMVNILAWRTVEEARLEVADAGW